MDKNYDHKKIESDLYKRWEKAGVFKPKSSSKKPFSIIMPPPNANGELHLGHTTFVAVSDTLIRYHRMLGEPSLWLPGVDHAGILSQVTFEKKLQKDLGKSRFDLGREEFVKQCYQFCLDNKHLMENQLKTLGASCDWSREKFTLDPEISKLVYSTFLKMYQEGLVYRGYRIVNWCPRCRSTLADVELEWQDRRDKLFYVRYPLAEGSGYVVVATTRVEPIWLDTHLAVNPNDPKNKHLIGKKVLNPITKSPMEIIGDEFVDSEFGTGVVKLTPAHDPLDYDVAIKHNLPIKNGVDLDGKLTAEAGAWAGLKTSVAREQIAEFLSQQDLIEKVNVDYEHSVATCERCGTVIEPLISRQWFVKIANLAKPALQAVKDGLVKITPAKYEAMYTNWMTNIRDWPISRQLWWGHQLPVWYARSAQTTEEQIKEFELLKKGDTRARTDILESPIIAIDKPQGDDDYIQDPDTFDTWFSSGQWPVSTLKTSGENDLAQFYPTSVMNTAYEILFLWVARMIMFGLYLTDKVPFETALINGVLRDEKGQKMSKSKNNGVNPNEVIEKYGADAVRFALLAGRDSGNDLLISKQQMEQRIKGYRNFSNKIWNASRFSSMLSKEIEIHPDQKSNDQKILKKMGQIVTDVSSHLNKFELGLASERVYSEFWHWYCDETIEQAKTGLVSKSALDQLLVTFLKLLHPFMPFVTEAVWQELKLSNELLIEEDWPVS